MLLSTVPHTCCSLSWPQEMFLKFLKNSSNTVVDVIKLSIISPAEKRRNFLDLEMGSQSQQAR